MADPNQQGDSEPNQKMSATVPKIRHDWYQTETHVILNILAKKIKETDIDVKYDDSSVNVSFPLDDGADYNLTLKLAQEINPSQCSTKVLPSKVEVKLKKKDGFRWSTLEGSSSAAKDLKQIQLDSAAQCEASVVRYPSSSQKARDWNKVVTDITKNDEDKPEGQAALNALFQKIYSEGSDEVRKAMNKSFVESGGTVLSTNWGEVQRDKVDIKPPDGMEWRKWDP